MSEEKDHYEVIGVPRDAKKAEITSAYRRRVAAVHPDTHRDDPEAGRKLMELNEAYAVLGDDAKKLSYDMRKQAGARPGRPRASHDDFFSGIAGSGPFGSWGRPEGFSVQDGEDVEMELPITFEEAVLGTQKKVSNKTGPEIVCGRCAGDGTEPKHRKIPCTACSATGRFMRGFPIGSEKCRTCHGRGYIPSKKCSGCSGTGREREEREVVVRIPVGIEHDQKLRVAGHGLPSHFGKPGDLIISVKVGSHPVFSRMGKHIHMSVRVPFEAAAGAEPIEVRGPGGEVHIVPIPVGFKPGETVLTILGGGVKSSMSAPGNMFVIVNVDMPEVKTARGSLLLAELVDELRSSSGRR